MELQTWKMTFAGWEQVAAEVMEALYVPVPWRQPVCLGTRLLPKLLELHK